VLNSIDNLVAKVVNCYTIAYQIDLGIGAGMTKLFTGLGDDGTTGLLGADRVKKSDFRLEVIGNLDELSANLGLAKSQVKEKPVHEVIEQVQRDLYKIMTEIAASPSEKDKFAVFSTDRVEFLEKWIADWEKEIKLPNEFILPGETTLSAAFSVCRTVTRRAERRMVELFAVLNNSNQDILRYMNRLSSLLFELEIKYSKKGGRQNLKFAKV
jgi:cob(I)alamin adenosyltransferase